MVVQYAQKSPKEQLISISQQKKSGQDLAIFQNTKQRHLMHLICEHMQKNVYIISLNSFATCVFV